MGASTLLAMFNQPTRRFYGEAENFVQREWSLRLEEGESMWHCSVEERLESRLIDVVAASRSCMDLNDRDDGAPVLRSMDYWLARRVETASRCAIRRANEVLSTMTAGDGTATGRSGEGKACRSAGVVRFSRKRAEARQGQASHRDVGIQGISRVDA